MSSTAWGEDPQPGATIAGPIKAGFWIRFGAALIDGILIGVISIVLGVVLGSAGQVIGLLAGIAYYIYLEGPGGDGQTLGKKAANIKVVSSTTGGTIGYGQATARYFGRILSSIPILLGYFWMLWDPQKQTWHDKLAGSFVVPADR